MRIYLLILKLHHVCGVKKKFQELSLMVTFYISVSKVGAAASAKKAKMEVETDPEKLINFCCGANIYVDGKDPEIKPDSEYPDWLWNLRLDRKAEDLSELDPNTPEYWTRLSRISFVRNIRIQKRLKRLKDVQYPNDKIV